ncbi:hypothetical protein [Streptomyces roseifaciens]|uniref:hypothetical protein n=1 Tax=Streptomyces roseifaciens TaxID=1488406 RepID=UPI0007181C92|nr:hypothetical protein [Streptomyces roseifaciens]
MQADPLQAIEIRPCLYYSTVQLALVSFDQQPEGDGVVSPRSPALNLLCSDASNYPLFRMEYLATAPEVVPPGPWDYQRTLDGMEIHNPPIKVLSLTGPEEAELDVPKGLYSLRILRAPNPSYEEPSDEPDEFIDDNHDEDAEPGEPEEHWLIQIWPQVETPAS